MRWTDEDKTLVHGLIRDYIKKLEDKGLKVPFLRGVYFTRDIHVNGYCKKYKNNNTFEIGISIYRMEDGIEEVKRTILHELCHAIAPFGAKHGEEWRRIAKDVGYMFGVEIDVHSEHTTHTNNIIANMRKYRICCDKCHAEWNYIRKTKFVKAVMENHGAMWRCSCGGNHFSINTTI